MVVVCGCRLWCGVSLRSIKACVSSARDESLDNMGEGSTYVLLYVIIYPNM